MTSSTSSPEQTQQTHPTEQTHFLNELLSVVERIALDGDLLATDSLMAMTGRQQLSPQLAALAEAFARMAVTLEGKEFRLQSTIDDLREVKIELEKANYDPLTNLANRVIARDRLGQAIATAKASGHPLAVLYLDLDKFKWVNDNMGHPAGDELLKQVAQRLLDCASANDTVARLGGDEFLFIVPGVDDTSRAEAVAKQCVATLNQPFALAAGTAHIGTSVGIALLGTHGDTVDALIGASDSALYLAKHAGRNGFAYAKVGG